MTAIGFVTKQANGGYKGQLRTLNTRAAIEIVPNRTKSRDSHPDYRIIARGFEVGAGWKRIGESSGREYVSLSLAAPEFGTRRLFAKLGRASGQDDSDYFAIIWNPAN